MGQINAENVYRGIVLDGGLGLTSQKQLPQLQFSLKATEIYDPDSGTWVPADPSANEIMAYLVLIDSNDKFTLSGKQVKKITGWDGASFTVLSEMNFIETPIQFRVEAKTYQENTTLQVTWVDTVDASPFRTVTKLEKNDVTALNAKYAAVLAANKSAAKPVSAPKTTKTATKPKTTKPKTTKPTTAPKTTRPTAPKTEVIGKCSADDAYIECFNLKRDDVTEKQLGDIWLAEVAKVNSDESKVTEEQWYQIKQMVLAQISKV